MFFVSSLLLHFFFQAEDGIRDYKVTGVQTCALPISTTSRRTMHWCSTARPPPRRRAARARTCCRCTTWTRARPRARRSEERRVGKECGSGSGRSEGEKQNEHEGERWEARQQYREERG